MGPGLRGPGCFVLAAALAVQAAPVHPRDDAPRGGPAAVRSPQPIRDSIEKAVRRVLEARVRPCAEADASGVPCFPAFVEVEGPRFSVAESLRSFRPDDSPSPSGPPTTAEMAPYRSGGPLSATGRVALGDPVCAVKSLWKKLKGEGGPYYLYRTWDEGGEHPLLTDHEIDPEDFASRPDFHYERALQGIGRVARLALGSGQRGADLTQDFLVTPAEARQGARKHLRYSRGANVEEVIVTIPAGVRQGTKLRLRGKGLQGTAAAPGDLYLRIQVTE